MDRPVAAPAGDLASAAAVRRELVRLIDVAQGQRLQATVAALLGKGRVMLGLMGGLVEASTTVELEVGRSYEFTIASIEPRIVLSAARPISPPAMIGALSMGLLGPVQTPGTELIAELLAPPRNAAPSTGSEGTTRHQLTQALANLQKGSPTASDLQSIHRLLGHDQEARVLRLQSRPQAAEVEVLQNTLKADALRLLRGDDSASVPRAESAARDFVAALNRIEVDNAQRTEQGAPQWLPLPVTERGELRDARMFTLLGDTSVNGRDATVDGAFTVVLLLDFTKLGQIRVDLQLRGSRFSAVFVAVEPSTVHSLVAAMPGLRERLQNEEVQVGALTVRAAPTERLPIADLVVRPSSSTSLVDIRA